MWIKNNKKVIISSIVTAVICISLSLVAYQYNAKEIKFTPEKEEWNVDNVEDAINSLCVSNSCVKGVYNYPGNDNKWVIDTGIDFKQFSLYDYTPNPGADYHIAFTYNSYVDASNVYKKGKSDASSSVTTSLLQGNSIWGSTKGSATSNYSTYFIFPSASTISYSVWHEKGGVPSANYGYADFYDALGNFISTTNVSHMSGTTISVPSNARKVYLHGQIGDGTTASDGCQGTLTITVS